MRNAAARALPREADEWIASLREIPDEFRKFDIDPGRAEAEFGVGEELALALIAQGLPHEPHDGGWRFADTDLHYVGLRLGCATPYLTAMRSWADAMTKSSGQSWMLARIRYVAYARAGSTLEILVPPGRWLQTTSEPDRTATRFEMRMRCKWPDFDTSVHELLRHIGSLDFCLVPPPLDVDSDFVRRTRLASCASAAHLLVEECARVDIEARMTFGLLLGCPFATPRHWAEIHVDDLWVPADPLLLGTLATYAGLDSQAWPATRCPGAILVRLADEQVPILTAEGRPVAGSFVTELSRAT
jgi:hypothetical protein